MSTIPSPRFYVYVLARPNGTPFYVGKGNGRRLRDHMCEARRACQCQKCRTIRKVWRQGGEVVGSIVFRTDDEQEAFDHERALIAQYGRQTLCNQTDGGEGPAGAIHSGETRQKRSIAQKIAWENPENRARRVASMKGTQSPEKKSAASKASQSSPESLARLSAEKKAQWEDPDYRAHMGAISKSKWEDPDYRARVMASRSTPEAKAKISATRKAVWARRKAQMTDTTQ